MKKDNIIKITSLNLALLTVVSISGFTIIKNKKDNFQEIYLSQSVETSNSFNNKNSLDVSTTISIGTEDFGFEENLTNESDLQEMEDLLEEQFYDVISNKDFDEQSKEALIYIYNFIDDNYDTYRETNFFFNMPSKQEFIQNNIIDCLENNVEKIKTGPWSDPEISSNLKKGNACYYYGTKEIYVLTNDSSTTETVANLLVHEFIGHANQKSSLGKFGDMDDILVEGGATWFLEQMNTEYSYFKSHSLYMDNGSSLESYGPDVAYKNNFYYKMFGTLMILTDYPTMMDAYQTKSMDGIINKINETTDYDAEFILNLMKETLSTVDDFDSNSVTAAKVEELDNIVLDILSKQASKANTTMESRQALAKFLKFEQQYMSRNLTYTDDGECIDNTDTLNKNLKNAKNIIVESSIKNNAIDGYTEEDYYDLLKLCTKENNKKIGVNSSIISERKVI